MADPIYRRGSLVLLAALAFCATGVAQITTASGASSAKSTDAHPLVFDVATVRVAKAHQYNGVSFTPDGAMAKGISLKDIIYSAYNQNHDELWSGGPAWISSEFYDLSAKFDPANFGSLNDEQRRTMVQALLAERFKLVVRRERKDLPHYALVVAKGGLKMVETKPEAIKRDDSDQLYCRAGLSRFRQCTMTEFARIVAWFGAGPLVEDRTGLTARYDFDLSWAPMSASPTPGDQASAPDIFAALPEQLGLKLEPIKGPVETFVIERVERPSEN